jgi:ketosteroid isomerase-like protein
MGKDRITNAGHVLGCARQATIMTRFLLLVVLTATLTAAGPADERALRAARTAQNEAIASGDLDRAAMFWTEDVTVRRALGQPLSGREAARKALEPPPAPAARLIYQRLTKEVEVSPKWPLAFETGVWEGHLATPTGPVVIGGRYSAQWVKRGDHWLIRSEVFVALTCSGVGCEASAVP